MLRMIRLPSRQGRRRLRRRCLLRVNPHQAHSKPFDCLNIEARSSDRDTITYLRGAAEPCYDQATHCLDRGDGSYLVDGLLTVGALAVQAVFDSRAAARSAVFDYSERFYNRKRRHSSLRYATPFSFEQDWANHQTAA
jgi:transposase InsO family protein